MNARQRRRRRRDGVRKAKAHVPAEFPPVVSKGSAGEAEESARAADAWRMAAVSWERSRWLGLVAELLRLVAAALAGAAGGQVA